MEEKSPNPENKPEEKKEACSWKGDYCWCKAIMAALIIVMTWWWTPDWANIAITILAVLIILGAGSCCCKSKCEPKK